MDPNDDLTAIDEIILEYEDSLKSYMNFNPGVMMFDEFSQFNHYKDNIDLKPICTYTICTKYADVLNVTLDSCLNDRLDFMLDAYHNNWNETWQTTMLSVDIQYFAELLHLLFQLSKEEMDYYSDNLKTHVTKIGQNQSNLYCIELYCIAAIVLFVILPFSLVLIYNRRDSLRMMDLLDEQSFVRQLPPQVIRSSQLSNNPAK